MHGNHGLGARPDRRFESRRVDRVIGVDIDEHRRRAGRDDGGDGGERRVRDGDHFVARPDVQRLQRQHQRISAAADADGVRSAAISRKLTLESGDLLAKHVDAAVKDARQRGVDRRPMGARLRERRCARDHETTLTSGT